MNAQTEIRKLNPYPRDIFPEMSQVETLKCIRALEKAGISPDRYSAYLMRIAYENAKEDCLAVIEAARREANSAIELLCRGEPSSENIIRYEIRDVFNSMFGEAQGA